MQQRWLVVALVLGMAGLSWAILIWPAPEPTAPAAADSAGDAAPTPLGAPPSAALPGASEPQAPEPASPPPQEALQPAAAPNGPAAEEPPPLFAHDMGPVDERKAQFASEPRDSAASDAEALLRDAFKLTDSPQPLLRSVLCRTRVCKLQLQLRADQLGAYVAAMTRITQHFDKNLAITRTAEQPGEVSIEIYAERLAPAQ